MTTVMTVTATTRMMTAIELFFKFSALLFALKSTRLVSVHTPLLASPVTVLIPFFYIAADAVA